MSDDTPQQIPQQDSSLDNKNPNIPLSGSAEDYSSTLFKARQLRRNLTTPPTLVPKTLLDQIQFYDDGTNRRIYFFVNNAWTYVSLSPALLNVANALLSPNATSLTLSNIPNYEHYLVHIIVDNYNAGADAGAGNIQLTFNGDNGNNYNYRITDQGIDAFNTAAAFIQLNRLNRGGRFFITLNIWNLSGSNKMINGIVAQHNQTNGPPENIPVAGEWLNTSSPINSITVSSSNSGTLGVNSKIKVFALS